MVAGDTSETDTSFFSSPEVTPQILPTSGRVARPPALSLGMSNGFEAAPVASTKLTSLRQSGQPSDAATKLQAAMRARIARECFLKQKTSAVTMQKSYRGFSIRKRRTQGKFSSASWTMESIMGGAAPASAWNTRPVTQRTKSVLSTGLAQAGFKKARQGQQVVRLHGSGAKARAHSYAETKAADQRRKRLLFDARRISPIDTVLRVDKIGQTVLHHLFCHTVTWIVLLAYGSTAVLCRYGYYGGKTVFSDAAESFEGSDILITFMIVFYVGYCYNRYSAMFGDLELTMRSIINCCAVARVCFKDNASLYDLWRFLNLLHVTAYCGCTATYNRANLCDEFCQEHGLLTDPSVRERLEEIDIESPQAWSTCMVWALEVVQERYEARDFSAPVHKELIEHIRNAGSALSRIYAQEYQVLPYIYTHLVSLACAIYLIVSAIIKGASATPALDGQTTALHAPLFQTSHPLASPLLSSPPHTPAHPLPLPDVSCTQQASTSSRTPPTCSASSSLSPPYSSFR